MKKKLLLSSAFVLFGFFAKAQSILGIDVSHYQGTINWAQVKGAGYVFSWAKATEGTNYTDVNYISNATNGVTAGVYMGAYHFAHPDVNSTNAGAISEAASQTTEPFRQSPTHEFAQLFHWYAAYSAPGWGRSGCPKAFACSHQLLF